MSATDAILAPLNEAQREAATAVRGPVVILAGAGTGKTTTITHRIAYQIASGTFTAKDVLAVTFTDKAASELKERLGRLGADGVEARTFHAAALSQLARWWTPHTGEPLPEVLDSKAPLIAPLVRALPRPHRFIPRSELAGEIEWAKNRRIDSASYLREIAAAGHRPPIPPELMFRIYDGYERRKRSTRRLDFEDMLELAIRLFDRFPASAEALRDRYRAFTVDEYQDVNPLQQALLERWLGGRDEICVVGDDYQTIYSFTGASPSYLLEFPRRFPRAAVVRLEENHRSTPQILTVANALSSRMGGFGKRLRPTKPDGPSPTARSLGDESHEVTFVVDECRRLADLGTSPESIAILYRINARSDAFEEAFAAAGIPYQVRGGAFLRRPGPRAVLASLRRLDGSASNVLDAVGSVTEALGFDPAADPDDDEEVTRQADLARMRALAQEYAASTGPGRSIQGFAEELTLRFAAERQGRGVQLMTYHRAKGLEFDVVFLPRLLDGELPYRSRRSEADLREERRLLYVGITRARIHLFLTWPRGARAKASPFLRELGVLEASVRGTPKDARTPATGERARDPLFELLRAWRRRRAAADGVPAYVVFHDATLARIVERRPKDWADLAGIPGIGPAKLERYADELLEIINGAP